MPFGAPDSTFAGMHDHLDDVGDEGYDSEEERMRERLQNMQRKKQVQDAAARQMEALRRHRAEREAAAKIAQSARFENLNTYINNKNIENPTSSLQNSDDEALLLAEHEARWEEIEAAAASINTLIPLITYPTLPWPPFGDNLHKYLLALTSNNTSATAEDSGNESGGGTSSDLRRAYTRACLRWHPDKFQHRFSRLVHEEEFEAIMARVQEVAQGINQAYQELR